MSPRRYRVLLRVFPRDWRQRYGPELLRTLEDDSGGLLRPGLNLVHSGFAERVRQFQHLTWSGVRFARGRALALAAGLTVAAVAFSLLTASVDVDSAQIRGTVGSHWRGAYDLLVLAVRYGPVRSSEDDGARTRELPLTVLIRAVGEFDPYRLPGFAGTVSPLASYRAPLLTGADGASSAALRGKALEPDGNIAGYAQQPPLLLTTLAGAVTLETNAASNSKMAAQQARAPIGSIRIRVSGLRGSVPEKLAKIAAIGEEIRKSTGLTVIVTAGSSPEAVSVILPKSRYGRPSLDLKESWTAVMVALVILREADRESIALFVLILVVCGLFLASAALAGVRGRREEIGVLRALGWGRLQVFALVLGEVAMLGLLAGLVGAALAVALIHGLALGVPLWRAVLVLPVAAVLALASGMVPAWTAARIEPAGSLLPAARSPRKRAWPARSITGLALTHVARVPGRVALATTALGAGVAGLAVLFAAQASFTSSIGDSALAGLVTATARGTDVLSAALAVGLGACAVADVTYLNMRERAGELASLAAAGWGRLEIGRLLGAESLMTSVLGAAAGPLAGCLVASYAFGLSAPVLVGAGGALVAGVLAAMVGTAAVLVATTGRPLARVLAADE